PGLADGTDSRRYPEGLKVGEAVKFQMLANHPPPGRAPPPLSPPAPPTVPPRQSQVASPAESASRLPNPAAGSRTVPSRRSVTLRRGEPAIEAFIPCCHIDEQP